MHLTSTAIYALNEEEEKKEREEKEEEEVARTVPRRTKLRVANLKRC